MKPRLIALLVVILLSFSIFLKVSATAATALPTTSTSTSFRTLAEQRGLHIGAALDLIPLQHVPNSRSFLIRAFDIMVTETAWHFAWDRHTPDRYNFTALAS